MRLPICHDVLDAWVPAPPPRSTQCAGTQASPSVTCRVVKEADEAGWQRRPPGGSRLPPRVAGQGWPQFSPACRGGWQRWCTGSGGPQEMGVKGPVVATVTVIKNVPWATPGGAGFGLRGQRSAPARRARPHCGRVVGTCRRHTCSDVRSPGPLLHPVTPEGGRWATGSNPAPQPGRMGERSPDSEPAPRDTRQPATGPGVRWPPRCPQDSWLEAARLWVL